MTKAKISEYSATAGDNTDVNGTNIAEGCPPSGINDAIREVMAALKRFETGADGDSVTVGGNLVVSGSTTANTFSATQITASGPVITSAGSASAPAIVPTGDTNTGIFFPAADTIAFAEGGAEAMRIDSSGNVGIGTSSPTNSANYTTLDIRGTNGGQAILGRAGTNDLFLYSASGLGTIGVAASSDLRFMTNSTGNTNERMRIDSSGNVGIGTSSPQSNLDVAGTNGGVVTIKNLTTSITTADVSMGSVQWYTSDTSGGNTGVFAKIDAASNRIFDGDPASGMNLRFFTGTVGTGAGTPTERARITSGGYFKASNTGSYVGSASAYHEFTNSANSVGLISYSSNASFSSTTILSRTGRAANSAFSLYEADTGDGADREFQLRGDGNAYADGSWNGSGADYAEYFESNGETIPRGTTVVLDGNKVRAATASDPASSIMGVVRPKEFGKGSMVVGNLAWNMWTDKYLTDDFGVYEMEDHDVLEWEETITDEEGNTSTKSHSYESHAVPDGVTVPVDATRKTHDEKGKKFQHRKLNPAWSADVEYTPREERPEWHIIGLLGQVPVLKGQPVGDRWIKMRDISETVEEWFIR